MLSLKTNPTVPTGRNKAHKLTGNGKQRDFVAYDLQGKGTFTNLVNQLDVTTFRHVQSTQTEAQQIRIVAHMRRIARELEKAKPNRVVKLNAMLDTYHKRLKVLQAIVANRKETRLNPATK